MIQWGALGVAFAAPRAAQAEDDALVGLFERHGVEHPKDPVLRRRALVAAQHLSLQCKRYYQVRGGGTGLENAACRDGMREMARIGPASAAAILDVLDDPRIQGDERGEAPFPALLQALGATGRAELVPVLLRALQRMEDRGASSDARVRDFGQTYAPNLLHELSVITFLTGLDVYAIDKARGRDSAITAQDFAEWYELHGRESREQWRLQALKRTRALLDDSDPEVVSAALCRLVEFKETKVMAVARLKAHVRSDECDNWQCSTERYVLQELEPWAKWTPPEWSPI
jgi:hypothetical protein